MQAYILKENVLSDDELLLPEKGKIFKGGYIAVLKIHTYLNSWNDEQTIKRFRSETELQKYLDKYYPNFQNY
jgi:hypothetical protein